MLLPLHLTAKIFTVDGSKVSYSNLDSALQGKEGELAQKAAIKRQEQRGDAGTSASTP